MRVRCTLSVTLGPFSEELKTNRTWLKLLVAKLSVLHGKEQYGTRHFLKTRVENKANKHPGFELFQILLFNNKL